MYTLVPVSYTHLDVYKRQVLTEADYEKRMKEYMASGDYRENDIEQLLVYFKMCIRDSW